MNATYETLPMLNWMGKYVTVRRHQSMRHIQCGVKINWSKSFTNSPLSVPRVPRLGRHCARGPRCEVADTRHHPPSIHIHYCPKKTFAMLN